MYLSPGLSSGGLKLQARNCTVGASKITDIRVPHISFIAIVSHSSTLFQADIFNKGDCSGPANLESCVLDHVAQYPAVVLRLKLRLKHAQVVDLRAQVVFLRAWRALLEPRAERYGLDIRASIWLWPYSLGALDRHKIHSSNCLEGPVNTLEPARWV